MLRATVRMILRDPSLKRRRKRGRKLVRFWSQDHFQRKYSFSHILTPKRMLNFCSWKSLFFYRCTDMILFAPLKSQGVDPRLKHIREETVAEAPPPCSPKSIYVLASLVRQLLTRCFTHDADVSLFKLGIEPLYKCAFADIKSKVSGDNVVDEIFSWVPAR